MHPVRPNPKANNSVSNRGDAGKIEELNNQIVELKVSLEGLEKERDFYFGKLRDIEVMCQEVAEDGNTLVAKILEVLYATEVILYFTHLFCAVYSQVKIDISIYFNSQS